MAESPREALLVANRISELVETPIRGRFDLKHLRAVHAHIFQDLPHHRPGEVRDDTASWSKRRMLEGEHGGYDVHYAHTDIAGRVTTILRELGGPDSLRGLAPDAFASRIARTYADLDYLHSFHEGNSRTLRTFTRALAEEAGYRLNWASTNVDAAERNRLYVARDIAVLERAFPGLTPERGMATNDRHEYEASLALPGLRGRGVSLEGIVRAGLSPLHGQDLQTVALAAVTTASQPPAPSVSASSATTPEAEPAWPQDRGPGPGF